MNQGILYTIKNKNRNWILYYAISALYMIILFSYLFFHNFSFNPKLYDDSWDYINISKNMDCISCLESPKLPNEKDFSLYNYITKTTKNGEYYDTCFFRLNRPFLYPLLIKMFGNTKNLNIFQNVIRSIVWILLAMSIFYLGFNKITSLALHGFILYLSVSPFIIKYQNAILTEDLNMSFWLLQLILFIVLIKSEERKRVVFVLTLITICNFLIVFLRDSSLIMSVIFIIFVYGYILFAGKYNPIKHKKFLHVIFIVNISFAIFSYLSILKSERYLYTITNQIAFHLGGDFNPWPKEKYPHLYRYDERDSNWFYINYPELKSINPPAQRWASIKDPFVRWEIDRGRQVWFKYVLAHSGDFMILMLKHLGDFMALMLKHVNYILISIFGGLSPLIFFPGIDLFQATIIFVAFVFVMFILNYFLFQKKKKEPMIFIWLCLILIIFTDFFTALTGDFPGELYRHANLSIILLAILLSFSIISVLDSFVELFSRNISKLAQHAVSTS